MIYLVYNTLILLLPADQYICVKSHDAIFGIHFTHMADFLGMSTHYAHHLNI